MTVFIRRDASPVDEDRIIERREFRHKLRAVNRELERLFECAYPGMVNGAAARYINYGVLFNSQDGCCARSRRS